MIRPGRTAWIGASSFTGRGRSAAGDLNPQPVDCKRPVCRSCARARTGDVGAHPTPSRCGWASTDGRLAFKQFTPPDPRGHVLGLLAVDRSVLELDDWILALSAQLLERVALTATRGPFTTSYWMPCSSSAFWTFQQGCALILTHIFGHRWSLIATFRPPTRSCCTDSTQHTTRRVRCVSVTCYRDTGSVALRSQQRRADRLRLCERRNNSPAPGASSPVSASRRGASGTAVSRSPRRRPIGDHTTAACGGQLGLQTGQPSG
jgi:hypothetical protein